MTTKPILVNDPCRKSCYVLLSGLNKNTVLKSCPMGEICEFYFDGCYIKLTCYHNKIHFNLNGISHDYERDAEKARPGIFFKIYFIISQSSCVRQVAHELLDCLTILPGAVARSVACPLGKQWSCDRSSCPAHSFFEKQFPSFPLI